MKDEKVETLNPKPKGLAPPALVDASDVPVSFNKGLQEVKFGMIFLIALEQDVDIMDFVPCEHDHLSTWMLLKKLCNRSIPNSLRCVGKNSCGRASLLLPAI